jgi:hypothetical protein
MLVVGLEEMQSLIDLEVDVKWDFSSHLWSYVVKIEEKKVVINLIRFLQGGS